MMSDSEVTSDHKGSQNSKDSGDYTSKLVPFIKSVLISLCVVFLVASSIQLYILNKKIFEFQEFGLSSMLDSLYLQSSSESQLHLWTVSELEVYAINQRYHQAHILLMSRIWIQYLSFFMGIILITIGSVFIFGKVSDLESSIDVENKLFGRILFRSTSPGLFMTLFGVMLIVFSFAYQRDIEVVDSSVYLNSYGLRGINRGINRGFNIESPDSILTQSEIPQIDSSASERPGETGN